MPIVARLMFLLCVFTQSFNALARLDSEGQVIEKAGSLSLTNLLILR